MSKEQRAEIDRQLRQATYDGTRSPQALRDDFAQLMAGIPIPAGIRTDEMVLGGLPALRVDPVHGRSGGTILYFHGGGNVFGSPRTTLSLTAHLVCPPL
jgi:monoterpene epsilon-lactone hydrolase